MAEVIVSNNADADLDRLVTFLSDEEPAAALATYDLVLGALEVLRTYPSIGSTGYLALYEYDERADLVVVLALRHQRELGY